MSLRIAQISDIHSEMFVHMHQKVAIRFAEKIKKMCIEGQPHVLALPGDLANGDNVVEFIDSLLPSPKEAKIPYIVFVAGNHEYHKGSHGNRSIDQTNDSIKSHVKAWNERNKRHNREMVFLDNSSFDITHEGTSYRFSGGTLWTDMKIFGKQQKNIERFKGKQGDYREILNREGSGIIEPTETVERHNETLEYIKKTVSQTEDVPDVDIVMTHHQPTLRTTLPCYSTHSSTPSAVSNLDDFIIGSRISLWMCGHSHNTNSVFIGGTLVSCNTYGYSEERNAENKQKSGKLDTGNNGLRVLEIGKYDDEVAITI